jgi:hypothetical protein
MFDAKESTMNFDSNEFFNEGIMEKPINHNCRPFIVYTPSVSMHCIKVFPYRDLREYGIWKTQDKANKAISCWMDIVDVFTLK